MARRRKSYRTSRDPYNPREGEVYESKWGNRWKVVGKTPKGRIRLTRAGNRFDGEVQWTPDMLAKLKQVRAQEAKEVQIATAPLVPEGTPEKFPSGASIWDRIRGLPQRDPQRRYYVYVIEQFKNGKREFYVGQTAKTPQQRFREHKSGHYSYAHGARMVTLRSDLTRKVNPLYTRAAAERAEKTIARVLRKRGLSVKGGH